MLEDEKEAAAAQRTQHSWHLGDELWMNLGMMSPTHLSLQAGSPCLDHRIVFSL